MQIHLDGAGFAKENVVKDFKTRMSNIIENKIGRAHV